MKGASGKKGRLKQKCFLYKILCTRGSKVRKLSVEIQKKKSYAFRVLVRRMEKKNAK